MTSHNSLENIRPWRTILRRKSRQISVGNLKIGGDAPILVQTMTNTLTSDAVSYTHLDVYKRQPNFSLR